MLVPMPAFNFEEQENVAVTCKKLKDVLIYAYKLTPDEYTAKIIKYICKHRIKIVADKEFRTNDYFMHKEKWFFFIDGEYYIIWKSRIKKYDLEHYSDIEHLIYCRYEEVVFTHFYLRFNNKKLMSNFKLRF